MLTPVRLCCGQRHLGPVCPDELVMCCLCFERVTQDNLNVTADDQKEDVCKECASQESSAHCDLRRIEKVNTAKLQKAIAFLQWLHDNCHAPDITAHDACSTCIVCRLIAELSDNHHL